MGDMSEFLGARKAKNAVGTVGHIVLNLMLAVGSVVVTMVSGSWVLGIVLVVLSKWRMFAVRPRYWFINIKSNMVDIIVGASLVLLVYFAGTELRFAQIILTVIYAVWLLFIKPRSSEVMTEVQALFAVFFGLSAAAIVAINTNAVVLVLAGFIIGYGASRHTLTQSDDHDFTLVTFARALMLAEICFILSHWLIVYSFPGTGIIVPQVAVIGALSSFVFYRAYKSIVRHDGKMRAAEVALPAIFTCLIVFIMIVWFSAPVFNV
jgi:hypothetical protein